jgi:hypothetical protein
MNFNNTRIFLIKCLANFHLGPSSHPLSYVVDKPFQFWHTFYAQKTLAPFETTPTLMLVVPIEMTFDHIKSSYNTW